MGQGEKEWWRGAVIYQIYPRSFMDKGSTGAGDLPGITEKLDYVASLGVDAVWLSPFFKSPMRDYGYDVADYCDVDPLFGTLADFKALLDKAHRLGLKIIVDLVLSHSSDEHEWFQESRSSRDNPKADWYIWADPKPDGSPPNNWQAHFGGPAWTFDIRRGQYYFHNFLPQQPDLNLRHPGCRKAVFDAARFWLDMGVDGFRLDAARHYFHDPALTDNPPNPAPSSSWFDHPTPFSLQIHKNDVHIPDSLIFMEDFREVLDEYDARMAVAEIGGEDGPAVSALYADGPKRIHTAYNFSLISGEKASASFIRAAVEEFERQPGTAWPSWAFSNHDVVRVVSRWGEEKYEGDPRFAKMLIAALTSLRGSVFLYQGEELGLNEATLSFEDIQDPWGKFLYPRWQGRDGCRTPMPWNDTQPHGGFTKAEKPWLPVPAEHLARAVNRQKIDHLSPLHFTRAFLAWRKDLPVLRHGHIQFHEGGDDHLLCFIRASENQKFFCAFNLSDQEKTLNAPEPVTENVTPAIDNLMAGTCKDGRTIRLPAFGLFYGFLSS